MLSKLIQKTRTYRKFDTTISISNKELAQIVELNRYTASPRNKQALKFITSNQHVNEAIFQQLKWAGALPNWNGPDISERPSAYIIILADNTLTDNHKADFIDMAVGISAQTMMLKATEMGFGGTMIAAFNKNKIAEILNLSKNSEIKLILALGKPSEDVEITEMYQNNFAYWRDQNQKHFVPKRPLNEILINQI